MSTPPDGLNGLLAPLSDGTRAPELALPQTPNRVLRLRGVVNRAVILAFCPMDWEQVSREQLIESAMDPSLGSTHAFWEGAGCIECGGTGFKGRTAICELMDLTDKIRDMILDRRPTSEIKRAARDEGMTFLRECAVGRVLAGITTLREINKVTFVE